MTRPIARRLAPLGTATLALALTLPAHADPAAGQRIAETTCASCHGADGNSPNALFPVLAGQTFRYMTLELRDFKSGRRTDPIMAPIAQQLSADDINNVSEYFAAQKVKPIAFTPDSAAITRGRARADAALCQMCHLGGFHGQNEVPRVAGQYPEYITKQLTAFKNHTRTNDAGTMSSVTVGLTDQDITDLAQYIANLQ